MIKPTLGLLESQLLCKFAMSKYITFSQSFSKDCILSTQPFLFVTSSRRCTLTNFPWNWAGKSISKTVHLWRSEMEEGTAMRRLYCHSFSFHHTLAGLLGQVATLVTGTPGTVGVVRQEQRSSGCPIVTSVKVRLGDALRNLIWWNLKCPPT